MSLLFLVLFGCIVKIMNTLNEKEKATMFAKYVCYEIKAALSAKKLRQTTVAKALGYEQGNLSKWLNGKPVMPIEVAFRICQYAGIQLVDIVSIAEMKIKILYQSDLHDHAASHISRRPSDFAIASYCDPYRDEEQQSDEW